MDNRMEKRLNQFKENYSENNIIDKISEMRKQNQQMFFNEKRKLQFQIDEFDKNILKQIDLKFVESNLTIFQKLELILHYLNTNKTEEEIIALLRLLKRYTLDEDFLFQLKDQNYSETLLSIIGSDFNTQENEKILSELTWILCNICFISEFCQYLYSKQYFSTIFQLLSTNNSTLYEITINLLYNLSIEKNIFNEDEKEYILNLISSSKFSFIDSNELSNDILSIFKNYSKRINLANSQNISLFICRKIILTTNIDDSSLLNGLLSLINLSFKRYNCLEIFKIFGIEKLFLFLVNSNLKIQLAVIKLLTNISNVEEIAENFVDANIIQITLGILQMQFVDNEFIVSCVNLLAKCAINSKAIHLMISNKIVLIIRNLPHHEFVIVEKCIELIKSILEISFSKEAITILLNQEFFLSIFEYINQDNIYTSYSALLELKNYFLSLSDDKELQKTLFSYFEKLGIIQLLKSKLSTPSDDLRLLIELYFKEFYPEIMCDLN